MKRLFLISIILFLNSCFEKKAEEKTVQVTQKNNVKAVDKSDVEELGFKNSLEISEKQLFIDGVERDNFKCPFKDKKSILFNISSGDFHSQISCWDEYLQGFYLDKMKDSLAHIDGDAGTVWSTQSMLFWHENNLYLWKRFYKTSDSGADCAGSTQAEFDECVRNAETSCTKSEKFYRWNEKIDTFTENQFKGKIPIRKIGPSAFYRKSCS